MHFLPQGSEHILCIPAQVGAEDKHFVRGRNTARQRRLHHAQFHGVGAGFKDGEDPGFAGLAAQPFEGGADRRRVMRKVVIDADPTGHTSQLHSPLYAHEVAKRCDCPCGLHASMGRCGYRGECVQSIVLALQLPVQAAKGLPAVGHLEAAIGVGGSREPAGLDAKYFDRTPLAHVQHSPKGRFGAVDNQPARTRHNTHQMMELPLDSRNIGEDVSMIELKIVQDRGFGAIVDKLGALVEKCRVIFVSFDHEKRGVCVPRRYGEIAGYATDQEPWLQPSLF